MIKPLQNGIELGISGIIYPKNSDFSGVMTENLIKNLCFLNFTEKINGFAVFVIKGIARKQLFISL